MGMIGRMSFLIGFCELTFLNALVTKNNNARILSYWRHRRYAYSTAEVLPNNPNGFVEKSAEYDTGTSARRDLGVHKRYLVEFRGLYPSMRMMELTDALLYYYSSSNHNSDILIDEENIYSILSYQSVFSESSPPVHNTRGSLELGDASSICGYISLPSEDCARSIASRCATVRSIVEVWGDECTVEEVLLSCQQKAATDIAPYFPPRISSERWKNSWKIHFRRYGRKGRSGLDPAGKKELLKEFAPVLLNLHGSVDLINPINHIIYMEDWHSYHLQRNEAIAVEKAVRIAQNTADTPAPIVGYTAERSPTAPSDSSDFSYSANRIILGRIIAEGPNIQMMYEVRQRPFVGTTTMNAVAAHLSAAAAGVGVGDLVLDPYCGTCSLLLAAAHLGARVVGSDIDSDSLFPKTSKSGSKNGRFRRKDGSLQWDKTPEDNFEFYKTRSQLLDLFAADVKDWCAPVGISSPENEITKYSTFDAIICDPPFGIREKMPALASSSPSKPTTISSVSDDDSASHATSPLLSLEEQVESVAVLFRVAVSRLSPTRSLHDRDESGNGRYQPNHTRAGKLVFWLPTAADVQPEDIVAALQSLIRRIGGEHSPSLQVLRVCPEKLNRKLWRWLCVLQRI